MRTFTRPAILPLLRTTGIAASCGAVASAFLLIVSLPAAGLERPRQTTSVTDTTCAGDCDVDGVVSIDELLVLVNIALGGTPIDACANGDTNGDELITIEEIAAAVGRVLNGCTDLRSQQVDNIVSRFLNDDTPAGAVLVAQGDSILHEKAYGLANVEAGEAATTDNVFLLCSVSKPFTAVAVLTLVEQRQLALDDSVSTYLPELQRFGNAITIRHLLQHTSGLPDYYEEPLWSALLARTPMPTNGDALALLHDMGEPLFAPGEQFSYLNGGYELLALIIERVSGQRFSDFQQTHIFGPVGMLHTFSIPDPEREATAHYAYSYAADGTGGFERLVTEADPAYLMYGAGDVVSNLEDVFRFDRALFSGRIISRDLLDQALTPARLNDGTQPAFLPFEPEASPGLGWGIGTSRGHRYFGHGGVCLGYRTYYAHFPDNDTSLIFLMARDYNTFRSRIVLPIADVNLAMAQ